jgi:hypothetical protein
VYWFAPPGGTVLAVIWVEGRLWPALVGLGWQGFCSENRKHGRLNVHGFKPFHAA